MTIRSAFAVDRHIGARIAEIRRGLGLTEADLASRIDVSVDQLRQHEAGQARVSARLLYIVLDALSARPADVYVGL